MAGSHTRMRVTELRAELETLERLGLGTCELTVYPAGEPEDVSAVSPDFVTVDFHVCGAIPTYDPADGYVVLTFSPTAASRVN